MEEVFRLWVYLSRTPLLWLTATLVAYAAADWISARLRRTPLANPVLLAVVILVLLLAATGTEYRVYFDGAQFVHFMLGPATVALAVPLVREARQIRRLLLPVIAALLGGSITSAVTAVAVGWLLGADPATLASLAPKSVTTPIAMSIAQSIGGIPALTAVCVILTGIIGAVFLSPLMRAIGVSDEAAQGFAAGVAAHGIGTARAFQIGELAGTFAGLGLALNGIATSILVPLLARLLR
ncbi:MAG TPA: LrgB family protein [Acetobacteraceae bacterium]|jgi:predicted murein hydrolase (TIGR00659 family)|nr:LrgB family protein [Acetobacteraceae bacterium]